MADPVGDAARTDDALRRGDPLAIQNRACETYTSTKSATHGVKALDELFARPKEPRND